MREWREREREGMRERERDVRKGKDICNYQRGKMEEVKEDRAVGRESLQESLIQLLILEGARLKNE